MRILCVGLATIDLIYRVPRIPGVNEKAQATGLEIATGGPAANAAVTAAALGAEVTLLSAVGCHPLTELIRADLETHHVRLIDATPDAPEPPPVSAVTVLEATGERTIVSRNAGTLTVDVPRAGLPDADLTLVDGHHPVLALAAARAARRLLLDAGTWRPIFADLLPLAEVVACSAAFRHPAQHDTPHPSWSSAAASAAASAASASASASSSAGPHPSTRTGTASTRARLDSPAHPDWQTPPIPVRPESRPHTDGAGTLIARDAALAAAIGAPHVIVTHGPDPVTWFSRPKNGTTAIPPFTAGAGDALHGAATQPPATTPAGDTLHGTVAEPPVAAVDTAGAGDAFHGAATQPPTTTPGGGTLHGTATQPPTTTPGGGTLHGTATQPPATTPGGGPLHRTANQPPATTPAGYTLQGIVAVPRVAAVDTAGAGDAFHGALAVALASAPPDKVAMSRVIAQASRVARVRVAHVGPRAWLGAL